MSAVARSIIVCAGTGNMAKQIAHPRGLKWSAMMVIRVQRRLGLE
jgi:hypothetical protein